MKMRHGSLFSGIGGFDLAAEWMQWENVFHCEINPFGRRVLEHYWPDSDLHVDITKTDFSKYENTIDVISGGFPCQPYSLAGKRKGKEDPRHLWPEMLRAIREIRPRWVVGENVFGLINWSDGLVFHEVQSDLEAEGYEVFPYVLPACALNAPHRRDRVWFVAYANSFGSNSTKRSQDCLRQQSNKEQSGDRGAMQIDRFSNERNATNANSTGQQERNAPCFAAKQEFNTWKAITDWSQWPTQSPVCGRDDGVSERLDTITVPARKGRRTLGKLATYGRWRYESIKAYGNAIVPQVVYQIFKTIEAYENIIN